MTIHFKVVSAHRTEPSIAEYSTSLTLVMGHREFASHTGWREKAVQREWELGALRLLSCSVACYCLQCLLRSALCFHLMIESCVRAQLYSLIGQATHSSLWAITCTLMGHEQASVSAKAH